jgi:hypothetical protein
LAVAVQQVLLVLAQMVQTGRVLYLVLLALRAAAAGVTAVLLMLEVQVAVGKQQML